MLIFHFIIFHISTHSSFTDMNSFTNYIYTKIHIFTFSHTSAHIIHTFTPHHSPPFLSTLHISPPSPPTPSLHRHLYSPLSLSLLTPLSLHFSLSFSLPPHLPHLFLHLSPHLSIFTFLFLSLPSSLPPFPFTSHLLSYSFSPLRSPLSFTHLHSHLSVHLSLSPLFILTSLFTSHSPTPPHPCRVPPRRGGGGGGGGDTLGDEGRRRLMIEKKKMMNEWMNSREEDWR